MSSTGRNSNMWAYIAIAMLGLAPAHGKLNIGNNYKNMMVRLNTNEGTGDAPLPTLRQGRVEVSFDYGDSWGTICSSEWSLREANVVCRQLNIGYAAFAVQSTRYGSKTQHPWGMVGTLCRGNERRLADCFRESRYPTSCNAANQNVSVVTCVSQQADLQLGLADISKSALLQSVPMSNLTCAMEENCVSKDAYTIRQLNPHAARKLLRFAVRAANVGNADFSPYANYREWIWHQCHQHFHSMTVFAIFDIYDLAYKKMAEGHKASFCLMDTECVPGITPKYTCGNTTQGISIGCSDIYTNTLDCQWVDVTNLPTQRYYILRVALNPEYRIGEISFENNGAECVLYYTGNQATTFVTNCKQAPLWFRK